MKVVHISPKKQENSFKPKARDVKREVPAVDIRLPEVDPIFKETLDFRTMRNQETLTPVLQARLDHIRSIKQERPKTAVYVKKRNELPLIQRRIDYTKNTKEMLYIKKTRQISQFYHDPIETIYFNRTQNTAPSYENMQTSDINPVSRKIPSSLNPRARPVIFF